MQRPHRSAVTAFAAEPTSATAARRFVRQTLTSAGMTQTICDRAELIVSELVTNAVLHAGTGPIVSVRIDNEVVRIEVEDTSPVAPVLREYGLDASTGRGLRVVSTAANEWGVETTSAGKAVWATLFTGTVKADEMQAASAPHLSFKETKTATSSNALDALGDEPTSPAEFTDVPLSLYHQLETHNESLVREFSLLAIQANMDDEHNMPERLRDAVVMSTQIDIRFTLLRIAARAASRDNKESFSARLQLTTATVKQLDRYETWARTADALSDEKLLLTSAAREDVQALRKWLVKAAIAQVRDGASPQSWKASALQN